MGYLRFFENNGCTGNQKGECTDDPGQRINFKTRSGFTNDDARSLQLLDVRAGAVIRVYDSADGKRSDDWCEIQVKRQVSEYRVDTFERSEDGDVVKVQYHRNNGLDGKVSRVEID